MRRIDLRKVNVARPNTIRDINRQIVLNYVRERGPISRAEIAQETELQRSTISLIVDELKTDGLIEELSGESKGGRPPIMLSLRTADAVAIGVDLGTIRTIVATSDLAGRVLEQEEFPTDPDARKTIERIICSARRLRDKNLGTIEGIGVSLPGLVDQETGTAIFIPHFKWRDIEIAEEIRSAVGLAVTADNDANATALAELWFGRPEIREVRDFIMVFIAEGVGTGIVFDRQIYRGEGGAAGEFGHMIIGERAPVPCSCGSYDCWEAFASGRAAVARYSKLAGSPEDSRQMSFAQLIDRALSGEGAAREALMETARYLGIGISNLIIGFSPQIVVVGGAITRAWDLVSDLLGEAVKRSVRSDLPSARITRSTIGDQASLMGALSLVLANKFASVTAT